MQQPQTLGLYEAYEHSPEIYSDQHEQVQCVSPLEPGSYGRLPFTRAQVDPVAVNLTERLDTSVDVIQDCMMSLDVAFTDLVDVAKHKSDAKQQVRI